MNIVTRVATWLATKATPTLSSLGSGWNWPTIGESFSGAWQSNVTVDRTAVGSYWAVFACVTLIAKDISKLPAVVMQRDRAAGIFIPTNLRLVLRKPNHYQTWLEFAFTWIISQLLNGNTYVLKERDPATGFVTKMYVLDPARVTPLVASDGSVYYQLNADNLAGLEAQVTVPAREIIHDRMYTLYHPLIGVSPIYACGVGAMQGLAIQDNSAKFFRNMSRPSGMLTAPGAISNETASRLKEAWESNYSAANIGRLAVLGDGLKYEAMTVNAADAQLIEQLKMTGEMIAACYHVPGYKIGVGQMPTVANTATLNQQYYDQCLQYLIEKMEKRLDEGLEIEPPYETWLDLNALLRMDPSARYDSHSKAIAGGWMAPNEARREEDMPPVPGGDTPYLQQQNYSLAALDRRDSQSLEDGGTDIQASVMNGAQIAGLQALITAAAAGEIPAESARATIAAAFPLLSAAQIEAMIGPLANFESTATPAPVPEESDDEESDDEESDDEESDDEESDDEESDDEARAFVEHLIRGLSVEAQA